MRCMRCSVQPRSFAPPPAQVIADELLGAAAAAQAGYAHPYDDPTYALQEEKLAAKAARDAARAAAAAAKAAR